MVNKLILILLMFGLIGCDGEVSVCAYSEDWVSKEIYNDLQEANESLQIRLFAQQLIGNCYKAHHPSSYTSSSYVDGTFKIVSEKDKDPYAKELKMWVDINGKSFYVWENTFYNEEVLKHIVEKNLNPIKCPGKP